MHQENWVAFNMVPPGLDISLRCHPSKRLLPLHIQGKHGPSLETGMEKHKIPPQSWGSRQTGPPPASSPPPSTCYGFLARGNPSVWAYLWPESALLPQRSFSHFFLKLSLSFKAELKPHCPFLRPTSPVRQQCFQNPQLHLNSAPGSFLWSVSSKFAEEGDHAFCIGTFTIALDKRADRSYVSQLDQLQPGSYKTRKDRFISDVLLSTTAVLVNWQLKAPCPEDNFHDLLSITS